MGASEHDVAAGDEMVNDPGLGYERVFEAGDRIYAPGDPPGGFFVIQSGEVDLLKPGVADSSPCLIARLGRGEFFGEMSVLLDTRRREQAIARLTTRVLELDRATFQAMCREQPEVSLRLVRSLASRLQDLERRLSALGVDDLVRPLVRVLLREVDTAADPPLVAKTLRDLSRETGLSVLESHRALEILLERRLVRLVDEAPRIPDVDALAAWLHDPTLV